MLQAERESFPAADWNDLVVVVTISWLEALLRIARRESRSERVHFMDGPFWADLVSAENEVIVDLVESRLTEDIHRYQLSINVKDSLNSTVSTVAQILHGCRVLGWSDPDLLKLDELKQASKKVLRDAKTDCAKRDGFERLE